MSHFRLERNLPPLLVTKDLVISLRSYLLTAAISLASDSEEQIEIEKQLKIAIKDKIGVETINSLEEFPQHKFSDSTDEVRISFSRLYGSSLSDLNIEIRITRNKLFSELVISCERQNAKESVTGIFQGIMSIIEPARNSTGWIYPPLPISMFLWTLMGMLPTITVITARKGEPLITAIFGASTMLLLLYHFVFPSLRRYTEFESRLTETKMKWWDWSIKGLLGFFIFGVLLTGFKNWVMVP